MNEQELREQIANEIWEAHDKCWSFRDCTCYEAAAIARGQK